MIERCAKQKAAALALFKETNNFEWAFVAAIFQELYDLLLDAEIRRSEGFAP